MSAQELKEITKKANNGNSLEKIIEYIIDNTDFLQREAENGKSSADVVFTKTFQDITSSINIDKSLLNIRSEYFGWASIGNHPPYKGIKISHKPGVVFGEQKLILSFSWE